MRSDLWFILYDWAGANAALLAWLQPDTPAMSVLAWLVSAFGSYWGAPVTLAAMAWWAHAARDARQAERIERQLRRFMVSGLLGVAVAWALKLALDLPRPFELMPVAERVIGTLPSTGSLPSGHSVYATLLAAALWPLVSGGARLSLVAAVLALGWSRVALGVHFPADVVVGWLVGLGCAVLARRIVEPMGATPRGVLELAHERLRAASASRRAGDLTAMFRALEQAHALGQRDLATHVRVHLGMLHVGAWRRDTREILGQLGRLALVPVGHLTGRLPLGNSGGADVSAFRPMPERLHDAAGAGERPGAELPRRQQPPAAAWWTLGFAIASLDLLVKAAVHSGLQYGISIPVTGFFNIVHRWNTGAAFSFLADAGGWQRYFLIALALAVSVFLLWLLRRPLHRAEALGCSLIVGGALGNAIDRMLRGYVVDYLDLHRGGYHWPAFNVADIAITTAMVVLIAVPFKGHGDGVARLMKE